EEPVHGWGLDQVAPARREREADVGPGQGEKREGLGDVPGLGALRAEELAARGYGPEEVGHLDRRPARMAGVADVHELPVPHLDLGPARRPRLRRAQDEMGDAGDRGKGLAPEAVRGHALEVGQLAELRGGVALEGLARVLRSHPVAVVADADPLLAARVDLDSDRARLRVERVLDQLLDHRRRPLHDLPRRDLVDEIVRETVDAAHADSRTGARRRAAAAQRWGVSGGELTAFGIRGEYPP